MGHNTSVAAVKDVQNKPGQVEVCVLGMAQRTKPKYARVKDAGILLWNVCKTWSKEEDMQ
eukprot:scaffold7744_cov76-Skeletonema_dohrnii-CCMP3373.AAC.4